MTRKNPRRAAPGALELIEEALHLLRLSPLSVVGAHYLGSLPFVLGFLYFWADMSRGSTAYQHCASSALGVALLFLWMKTWQAIFASRLKAQITGRPAPRLTVSRFFRAALIQIILQPSGLFFLTLSLVTVVPFGWVYGFYQNVTAFASEDGADARQVFRKAIRQALLWPGQNHLLLGVLLLFGLAVFMDVAVGLVTLPSVVKMLFGIETAFGRSAASFLNTTFVASVCGLTYLCLDPLLKAVYRLRCYYGESLNTGEDLKAELKRLRPTAPMTAILLFLVIFSVDGRAGTPMEDSGIPPAALDRSLDQVLRQPQFNWRLPREQVPETQSKKGFFAAFVDGVIETISNWAKAIGNATKAAARWLADAMDWLREKILGKRPTDREGTNARSGWMALLQALVLVLIALAASAVAILFYRTWKRRGVRNETASEAIAPLPDLADENLTANQLPEDDWLILARDLMAKGDLRLALRALYLASLAHLAGRELISVAKFKSNRDYELELRRRARGLEEVQAAFAENVGIFDRVWYGLHEVTQEALGRFQINLEKIKSC